MLTVAPQDILYVDDEPANLRAFSRAFVGVDFIGKVHTAPSPEEGLAILDREEIAVVVSDQRMPSMSGTDFLARVIETHPEPVRILLTAYTDVGTVLEAINRGHVYNFVTKPWDVEELRLILRRGIEHYELTSALKQKGRELARAYAELEIAHREQVRLYEQVITDEKTGLRNYHFFRVRLREEFERVRRYGGDLAVAMMDIDDFKRLNDSHGHVVGDLVLGELARYLAAGLRAVDIVARYGGEEFSYILPMTNLDGGRATAERVRKRVADTQFLADRGPPVRLTVSFGIAGYPHAAVSGIEDLLQKADAALYKAKARGKNRVVVDGE
jgi:diguanylate cyclase (GGDEF)-like protein